MTHAINQDNSHVMVPPFGAQLVPPKPYVAANDNSPVGNVMNSALSGGQIAVSTFGPLHLYPEDAVLRHGPFIQTYPAGKFWPFDPRPEEVTIGAIAHGLSNLCRYSGAVTRFYSVAEHCTLIARWLALRTDPVTALCGLLHDAPEALSGFGDVARPVKGMAPVISDVEAGIWRNAVAVRFGLPIDIPKEVHTADTRITADEVAENLMPMDWHLEYGEPLGVSIRCWSPERAAAEFMETFAALTASRNEVK